MIEQEYLYYYHVSFVLKRMKETSRKCKSFCNNKHLMKNYTYIIIIPISIFTIFTFISL